MNNRYIPLFFFAMLLFSCGDDVRFEVPQPEGSGNEDAFPKKIWGVYRNLEDSSLLVITPVEITHRIDKRFVVHKSLLDSELKIKNDTSFYDAEDKMNVTVRGDSAYGRLKYVDTLFYISSTNVLRIFKGYYFLNRETSFNNWEVKLMTFKGKELTLLYDWSETDLVNMRQITHSNSAAKTFNPSRGQLRKFIREKSLKDGEKYKRISGGIESQKT